MARSKGAEKWLRAEKLREAEVAYITDPQQRSAEYWWDHLCSTVMPLGTFMRHISRGRWVIRREQYWSQIQQEVLRKSQNRVIHDRVQELQEIQELRADILSVIKPRVIDGVKIYPVKPNSLEGMVGALTKLDQLADTKRDAVLTMIEPQLARKEHGQGPESVFSPDEMRDVARMLLERRREQQQARLTTGDPDAQDTRAADQEGDGQEDQLQEGDQEEGHEEGDR